ncbi:hypothetical protein [Roseomonas sp. CECT 9278]|uniref:hypothetical protein n=1 Tax=Roseomonas sp. CECT 9278 TaxID=2845823 RepID=UPI001E35E7D8|nr:hypothetical protein [Roseomonas sp. CECT 9278]CAH0173215.1 hypothetical protein ROS9278_01254 [Roseomonas sp. CECT 9278]
MKMIPVLAASLLAMAGCTQTAPGTQSAPGQAVGVPTTVPMAYAPGTVATVPGLPHAAVPVQPGYVMGAPQVVISGDLQTSRVPTGTNTAPKHDLVVRVNGQPVIAGTLATYGTTTLEGQAGATPVSTTCMSRELAPADRQFDCRVSLNGQPASILSFRATPVGPQQPVAPMMTLTAG